MLLIYIFAFYYFSSFSVDGYSSHLLEASPKQSLPRCFDFSNSTNRGKTYSTYGLSIPEENGTWTARDNFIISQRLDTPLALGTYELEVQISTAFLPFSDSSIDVDLFFLNNFLGIIELNNSRKSGKFSFDVTVEKEIDAFQLIFKIKGNAIPAEVIKSFDSRKLGLKIRSINFKTPPS